MSINRLLPGNPEASLGENKIFEELGLSSAFALTYEIEKVYTVLIKKLSIIFLQLKIFPISPHVYFIFCTMMCIVRSVKKISS